MDPSVMGSGFAYTQRDAEVPQVVIVPSDGSPTVFIPDAESPALFGSRVAYQDALGVAVANWRDPTQEVIRVEGRLEKPGLWGRWLVYRKYHGHELARANRPEHAGHERYTLHLHDLVAGTTRTIAESGDGVEIGRPSIAGDRIAWHIFGTGGSKIVLYRISTGRKTVLLRTKRWMLANPSLTRARIIWVRDTSVDSTLYTRRLDGTRIRVVATVRRPPTNYWLWTTWLYDGQAYVTRWNTAAEVSRILRERI
jgi:hypothetical protein